VRRLLQPDAPAEDAELSNDTAAIRGHILRRLQSAEVGQAPFHHTFIENIFPAHYFDDLRAYMLAYKGTGAMQPRRQDNQAFVNRRYNLVDDRSRIVQQLRSAFENTEIKRTLFAKFYSNASEDLIQRAQIHDEFEFVYCEANRFQNIHVDIPPKLMSFVFYIPERPVSEKEEELNATVLYDKSLQPRYSARFRSNSVCIFVPHFYSYHGFASTIERDVLVMFYVDPSSMRAWRRMRDVDRPPYTRILDLIEGKLRRYPLREYGDDPARIAVERAACRINAPNGRVLVD